MFKKLPIILLCCVISIFGVFYIANALSTYQVIQGGTGAKTFTSGECLVGNGTGAITTTACGASAWAFSTTTLDYWFTNTAGIDTDGLGEGSTNLWYTDGRVADYINASTTMPVGDWNLAYGWGDHSVAGYYAAADFNTDWDNRFTATTTWEGFSGLFDTDFAGKSTTDLSEGTNLYWTNARFDDRLIATTTWSGNLTIDGDLGVSGSMGILDADVPDTITASNYLDLTGWYATTTHALISSLPSLDTVGTLTSGGTGAGFTIDFANSTLSGTIGSTNIDETDAYNWSGINTFSNNLRSTGGLHATTTIMDSGTTTDTFYANRLGINSEYFNDLTGTGLQNTAGVLTLNATGDWTGTLDSEDGSYYLDNNNFTNKDWISFDATSITPSSSSIGFFVNASSTVAANFRVDGNATTTGSHNIDGQLTVDGVGSFANATFTIDSSGNLITTGYASSTTGLFTQGDIHIGGNLTADGTGHDSFSDYVANEHLDWTSSVGTIHADNYTNTTYLGGTNITLAGTTFNLDATISLTGLTAVNGTSTGSWVIPQGASPDVDVVGEIAIDTTSGQFKFHDGRGVQVLTASTTKSFNIASTTMDDLGNSFSLATSTFLLANNPEATTLMGYFCQTTSTGSVFIEIGDGTNFVPINSCDTTGVYTEASSNNTWTAFEDFIVRIGGQVTDPARVTVTTVTKPTSD